MPFGRKLDLSLQPASLDNDFRNQTTLINFTVTEMGLEDHEPGHLMPADFSDALRAESSAGPAGSLVRRCRRLGLPEPMADGTWEPLQWPEDRVRRVALAGFDQVDVATVVKRRSHFQGMENGPDLLFSKTSGGMNPQHAGALRSLRAGGCCRRPKRRARPQQS